MGKIIVLGSINMDVVVLTPNHPLPGETLFGTDVQFIPGGKGANQAVAAGRLADEVVLVGKLGQDAFGTSLAEFLGGESLELRVGRDPDAPTGTALITVDDNAENSIIVISGSNMKLSPDDIDSLPIARDDILVSVFEVPQETIKAAFEKARDAGARTILNPAPAVSFIPGLQELCDYMVVNETELAFFAEGEVALDDPVVMRGQLERVRSRPGQAIIVTLGPEGAVCQVGDEFHRVPGRKVDAVDATGAGDCFVGALGVGLKEGMDLREAISFANKAASLSVQKLGASSSLPYRSEVDALGMA
jgi:ribokinase